MIELTNDLYIIADDMCFTLSRKRIVQSGKDAGKEMYKPLGYYSTLSSALQGAYKALILEGLRTEGVISLKDAITLVDELHTAFTELLDNNINEHI